MINTISNTVFIGKVFQHFEELASTNEYAIELLSKNKPSDGTVISTYNQPRGRGQIGSSWESEAYKNLSLSLILYPDFLEAQAQFLLNQIISLGVFDFISNYTTEGLKVKWPNDVYIHRNKLAGILFQNALQGTKICSSVIGIGINVNQTNFQKAPNPTSLSLETGQEYDLEELVQDLCLAIEGRYLQLKENDLAKIQQNYLDCLYQFEEIAPYQRADGSFFEGKIIGIDNYGRLKIQTKNEIESFLFKEIVFL